MDILNRSNDEARDNLRRKLEPILFASGMDVADIVLVLIALLSRAHFLLHRRVPVQSMCKALEMAVAKGVGADVGKIVLTGPGGG